MNKLNFALISLLAAAGNAAAYDISYTNLRSADATAVPVIDNAGVAIAGGSGYVASGFFSGTPSIEAIRGGEFTLFGNMPSTAFANGEGNIAGFFDLSGSEPIPAGTTDGNVGRAIFVVIGNGGDLATSDEFAVIDAGAVVGTENAAGQGSTAVIIDQDFITTSNLVVGNLATDVNTGLAVTFNEGIQLVPVPEPSTALFGALAALGFAGRRRRA